MSEKEDIARDMDNDAMGRDEDYPRVPSPEEVCTEYAEIHTPPVADRAGGGTEAPDVVNRLAGMVGGKVEEVGALPDGSGFAIMSMPLPKDHWLTQDGFNVPPMPWRRGVGPNRASMAEKIREAAKYAIRASTMNGKEIDFDPDAMVQNFVVGMLGYWTEDGLSGDDFANPKPAPSERGEPTCDDGPQAKCYDCGRLYGNENGFPDLVIPCDSWRRISPTGDYGGLLCPSCVVARLVKAGIRCEGAFMSGPIISVDQVTMDNLRRVENIELAIEGRDNRWAGIRELVTAARPAAPDRQQAELIDAYEMEKQARRYGDELRASLETMMRWVEKIGKPRPDAQALVLQEHMRIAREVLARCAPAATSEPGAWPNREGPPA